MCNNEFQPTAEQEEIIKTFSNVGNIQDNEKGNFFVCNNFSPVLRRRMIALVQEHPEWQKNDFTLYFREDILNNGDDNVYLHLRSYLLQTGCKALNAFKNKFGFLIKDADLININLGDTNSQAVNGSNPNQRSQWISERYERFWDFFDNPNTLITYLQRYNPNPDTQLSSYLFCVFMNIFRNSLTIISDWRLLCDINTSRPYEHPKAVENYKANLRNALKYPVKYEELDEPGLNEPEITWYIFVWEYFVIEYRNNTLLPFLNNPSRKKGEPYPPPKDQDYENTARVVNRNRKAVYAPAQADSMLDITAETVERWMKICIRALRQQDFNQTNDKRTPLNIVFNGGFDQLLKEYIETEGVLDFDCSPQVIPEEYRRAVAPLSYGELTPFYKMQKEFLQFITNNRDPNLRPTSISRLITKVYINPLTEQLSDLIEQQQVENFAVNDGSWYESYIRDFLQIRYTLGDHIGLFDDIILNIIELSSDDNDDNDQNITLLRRYATNANVLTEEETETVENIISDLVCIFESELIKRQKKDIREWLRDYVDKSMRYRLSNCCERLSTVEQTVFEEVYINRINLGNLDVTLLEREQLEEAVSKMKNNLTILLIKSIADDFALQIPEDNARNVIDAFCSSLLM